MLALLSKGLEKVFVVDIMEKRLKKALELGATKTINATIDDPAKTVLELTNGAGCDIVIDTSGADSAIAAAVEMTKKGAHIVFVGYSGSGMLNLPVNAALNKELTFNSVFRYRHIYPSAIEAVSSGSIRVKDIVTHCFDFDDLQTALEQSHSDKENIVKGVVKITKGDATDAY